MGLLPTMSPKLEATTLATVFAVSVMGLWFWQHQRRKKVYVPVGHVSQLYFFPIKSLKGITVPEIQCTDTGVEVNGVKDRSIMLVDADGLLVSQRQEPSLVLLTPEISGNQVIVHAPDKDPLHIDISYSSSKSDKLITCTIHTDTVQAADCGDDAAAWFQDYLKRPDVRVMHQAFNLPQRKYTRENKYFIKLKEKYPTHFQDLAPFHILSQSSIDVLNTKIENEQISVHNFRPNILIDGAPAFDEDNWGSLQFSDGAEMIILEPTGRCIMTTNNPDIGIKTDKEPLVTLRKFRMLKDREQSKKISFTPTFGVNGWLVKRGVVKVGDIVSAVREEGKFECKEPSQA